MHQVRGSGRNQNMEKKNLWHSGINNIIIVGKKNTDASQLETIIGEAPKMFVAPKRGQCLGGHRPQMLGTTCLMFDNALYITITVQNVLFSFETQ